MNQRMVLKDTKKFTRDMHSKGLVSVDNVGLKAYRARKKSEQTLGTLEKDINSIQEELAGIKGMLTQLLERLDT